MQVFDPSSEVQRSLSDKASTWHGKTRTLRQRLLTVVLAISTFVLFISTITLAIILGTKLNNEANQFDDAATPVISQNSTVNPSAPKWPEPSGSLYGRFKRAAIVTDNSLCSEIGRSVFMHGGNAIDATIAAMLCIGVVNPQSSGLGGGFMMVIYNSTTQRCMVVNARETAPATANRTMFVSSLQDAVTGYRSIATPSQLHGLRTIYSKFGSGKIEWKHLFQPSIDLALNGFAITASLARYLAEHEEEILADPIFTRTFVNPDTKQVYREGDIIKREHLGVTMQLIANSSDPLQLFYHGGIAQTIAAEIDEHGGHVTLDDLHDYRTVTDELPIINEHFIGDLAACGPPPPSGFIITQSIIAVMAELYRGSLSIDLNDPLLYHRLIEAEKFAFAERSNLGDIVYWQNSLKLIQNMTGKDYIKWIASQIGNVAKPLGNYGDLEHVQVNDYGTSHFGAIDRNFNAVSCTATINRAFGSTKISPTLGIVWNNEMDDFSTPGSANSFGYSPSAANYIEAGKRPMSSMSPMVVYNKNTGKVKLVIGASGGPRIISATAQTTIWSLLFNQTIKQAIDMPRLHNQFLPPVTNYENTFPPVLIDSLAKQFGQNMSDVNEITATVQALYCSDTDGYIYGNSDPRRDTFPSPAGF